LLPPVDSTWAPARAADRPETKEYSWAKIRHLLGGAFTVLACLPLVGAAVAIAAARPDTYPDGDQAVDQMGLIRAEHFAQLTGNYSRFGWDHPGPAWFYAVDTVYAPLGNHSYAFYIGVLLLHALAVVLIVTLLWRARGHLAAAVTCVLVLLYLVAIGPHFWRAVWPPYAPILWMALLFPMAAWGAVRSNAAFVGALLAGSYAVQTHVGTALTVFAVWAVMAVIRIAWWRWDRRTAPRARAEGSGASGLLAGGGVFLLVLMWLPPAVDEFAGQHNLSHLATFFLTPRGQHGWHESLSALGTLLSTYTTSTVPYTLQANWEPMPASSWTAIGAFLFFIGALLVAATLVRDRFVQALALLLAVAFPVLVISVKHVVGPIYPYFLLWTTSLPMVLAIGWGALLTGQLGRVRWRFYPVASVVAAMLLLAPSGMLIGRWWSGFQRLPSPTLDRFDPYSLDAWWITQGALGTRAPQPIVVDITKDNRIPMASGIALQLRKAGWKIEVNSMWNYIFGPDSVASGDARIELVLVDPKQHAQWAARLPDMRLIGRTPDAEIYLRPLYPGESP